MEKRETFSSSQSSALNTIEVYEASVSRMGFNTKALTYKGRGCVWAQQSWNSNSILGLQQARFYHVVSFGNIAEADQTRQQFSKLQDNVYACINLVSRLHWPNLST